MNDYYNAPSDAIFEEVKKEAIKIWETYDNTYGYVDKKVGRIKDMQNVKDNTLFIVQMFDCINIPKLLNNLSPEAKEFVSSRIC